MTAFGRNYAGTTLVGKGVTRKKKAGASPKPRHAARRARTRLLPASNSPLEPLALELLTVIRHALTDHGLSVNRQRLLFTQALRAAAIPDVSGPLLQQFCGLGDLIAAWLEDMPYVDAVGKPRILTIEGPGATFESLAREFLPEVPLPNVVDLACRFANAGTLPGGRIALYGDTMVNFSKSPESALAQTISHIRKLVGTCLHNVQTAQDETATGRLERIVGHVLSLEDFEKFLKIIRPQLHDQCERVDRLLKAAKKPSRHGATVGTAGIGLYVFFDATATPTAPRQKELKRRRQPSGRRKP